jgi:hypothetical protein
MNRNDLLAALVILGLLTAGCIGTPGTGQESRTGNLAKAVGANEALSMFDGYLERSPADWYINGSFCGSGMCRQQLISADGDTIVVTLTGYSTISDAENAFNTMKKSLGAYSPITEKIADSGYVWKQGTRSESGFLSGKIIGVLDYQYARGNATGNESIDLANVLAQILVT